MVSLVPSRGEGWGWGWIMLSFELGQGLGGLLIEYLVWIPGFYALENL